MKTKKNHGRIGSATLITLLVVSIIACVIFQFIPGKDYTADYGVYSDVKEITGTYELMDYCHAKGISYSIVNNVFKLEGYTLTFSLNKSECVIKNDNHMNNIWLLENGHYDHTESSKTEDGSIVKSYILKTWGTNYESCNGTFTVYNMWPALISFFAAILFAIMLVQKLICHPTSGRYERNEHQE